jgi:hypothetical protein
VISVRVWLAKRAMVMIKTSKQQHPVASMNYGPGVW